MARLPRINIANIPQHIIQVGHNNLNCFFDDEDYEFYLALLNSSMNGLGTPAMRGLELVAHTISRSNFTSPFDVI